MYKINVHSHRRKEVKLSCSTRRIVGIERIRVAAVREPIDEPTPGSGRAPASNKPVASEISSEQPPNLGDCARYVSWRVSFSVAPISHALSWLPAFAKVTRIDMRWESDGCYGS